MMTISKRINVVQGRYADSWARVINGKLFLFIQGHQAIGWRNQPNLRVVTERVSVYEIAWEDLEELARVTTFTYAHNKRAGSTLRHCWRAS